MSAHTGSAMCEAACTFCCDQVAQQTPHNWHTANLAHSKSYSLLVRAWHAAIQKKSWRVHAPNIFRPPSLACAQNVSPCGNHVDACYEAEIHADHTLPLALPRLRSTLPVALPRCFPRIYQCSPLASLDAPLVYPESMRKLIVIVIDASRLSLCGLASLLPSFATLLVYPCFHIFYPSLPLSKPLKSPGFAKRA